MSSPIITSSNNDDEIQSINECGKEETKKQSFRQESKNEVKNEPKNESKNDISERGKEETPFQRVRYILPFIFILFYLAIGVAFYIINGGLKNNTSSKVSVVDVFYFIVATLSTVGYGDIIPYTVIAKICTCVFILVGFALSCLLNNFFGRICGALEKCLVRTRDEGRYNTIMRAWMFDDKNKKISKRAKVFASVIVIVLLIFIGTFIAHRTEKLHWIDSLYLSVTSVTTVGYGDYSFKTSAGKWWASIWILISTVAVASSFTYLSKYDLQSKSDDMTQWILNKKITSSDLAAEGLDKDGLIIGYDFAIHMLKQMGKISESEIQAIGKQFNSMPKDANGNIILDNFVGNV